MQVVAMSALLRRCSVCCCAGGKGKGVFGILGGVQTQVPAIVKPRILSVGYLSSSSKLSSQPSYLAGSSSSSKVGAGTVMNTGDLGKATLKVTDKCKQRLSQILDEKGSFLRVSVEGGGCSGFQYKFNIENQMGEDDVIVSRENGEEGEPRVVIDQMSLDLIGGSTLDYETELIRSSFRIINNPLAEQGCSCGASFNMKLT